MKTQALIAGAAMSLALALGAVPASAAQGAPGARQLAPPTLVQKAHYDRDDWLREHRRYWWWRNHEDKWSWRRLHDRHDGDRRHAWRDRDDHFDRDDRRWHRD